MKKIIFILVSFFICNIVFASTYAIKKLDDSLSILYYNDNGGKSLDQVIIDSGLSNLPYEKINSLPDSGADRDCWRLVDHEVIVDETCLDSQEHAVKKFNVSKFTDDLNKAFVGEEAIPLIPYYAVIKDYAAWPDFANMKSLVDGLVSAGILSQDGYTTFKGVLMLQNIDLDLW